MYTSHDHFARAATQGVGSAFVANLFREALEGFGRISLCVNGLCVSKPTIIAYKSDDPVILANTGWGDLPKEIRTK
jgi:hypothetical protein